MKKNNKRSGCLPVKDTKAAGDKAQVEKTVKLVTETGSGSSLPPDRDLYEYAVIRYVPRVDRQEFINVGLLMMCKRRRWLRGAIHIDEQRVRVFDPRVNLRVLTNQLSLFERCDVPFADAPIEEKYRWLTAAKSAVIQLSPSHPGLLTGSDDTLEATFDRLLTDLVKP